MSTQGSDLIFFHCLRMFEVRTIEAYVDVTMRQKDDDEVNVDSIPFFISLQDLVCLYDRLLIVLNSQAVTPVAFSKLRLVCSLLNHCSLRLSQEQRDIIESTCRRAHLLEILLMNDDQRADDVVTSPCWMPVEVVNSVPLEIDQVFEWKYEFPSDICDDNEGDDHPIVSISKEELIEEEALLMQMAYTPIPTEVSSESNEMNSAATEQGSFFRETMQQRIRDLWGEVACQEKVEQLRQSKLKASAK